MFIELTFHLKRFIYIWRVFPVGPSKLDANQCPYRRPYGELYIRTSLAFSQAAKHHNRGRHLSVPLKQVCMTRMEVRGGADDWVKRQYTDRSKPLATFSLVSLQSQASLIITASISIRDFEISTLQTVYLTCSNQVSEFVFKRLPWLGSLISGHANEINGFSLG